MKRHNPTSVVLVVAFAAMTAAGAAAAANFPIGTHLVKGTLKDWQNKVLTSSAAVTIQAVATNGTVIASTKVANPTADSLFHRTFRLTSSNFGALKMTLNSMSMWSLFGH